MKCQCLFSAENKKNIINLLSAGTGFDISCRDNLLEISGIDKKYQFSCLLN